jgi:hypothetical protein
VEVTFVEILRALRRMDVRIDEAREYNAPAEIDDPRVRAGQRAHIAVGTGSENRVAAHRQRAHDAMRSILRVNAGVGKHELRRVRCLTSSCGREQREQQERSRGRDDDFSADETRITP